MGVYYTEDSSKLEEIIKRHYELRERTDIELPYLEVCNPGEVTLENCYVNTLEVYSYIVDQHRTDKIKLVNDYFIGGNKIFLPECPADTKYLVKYNKIVKGEEIKCFSPAWRTSLYDLLWKYDITREELFDLLKQCSEEKWDQFKGDKT